MTTHAAPGQCRPRTRKLIGRFRGIKGLGGHEAPSQLQREESLSNVGDARRTWIHEGALRPDNIRLVSCTLLMEVAVDWSLRFPPLLLLPLDGGASLILRMTVRGSRESSEGCPQSERKLAGVALLRYCTGACLSIPGC